jgi:hypothetical protein
MHRRDGAATGRHYATRELRSATPGLSRSSAEIETPPTPRVVPTDPIAARMSIESRSAGIAREALAVEALAGQLKGNKSFLAQATRDYANRFLYELLQNAYDAHPSRTEGSGYVLLDLTEGEYGVLYVANAGLPFDSENLRAITEVAQSSRRPGEGIGNKGVGFKSVLQISEWPEVFSCSSATTNERFDGYTFGFARPHDFLRLSKNDASLARVLAERVSPYALPVVVTEQGPTVREFREAGFTTVFRLPLRSAKAAQAARAEIDRVLESDAPVTLFLDRLATLTVEKRGEAPLHHVLRRHRKELDAPAGLRLEEIDLDILGRFLVASRTVPVERFRKAVEESIAAQAVDESWSDWVGDAVVSVAIRLDQDQGAFRLYCYLPMGKEAVAPLAGHVNAPFAVKLARDGLVDARLNEVLFEEVGDACVAAASRLRPHPAGRQILPDLLSWSHRLADLEAAFERSGTSLSDARVIPVLGRKRWGSLEESHYWDASGLSVLTAETVSRASGAFVLDPDIGDLRVKRLVRLHLDVQQTEMRPTPEIIAEWVQSVARELRDRSTRHFDPDRWLGFYDDLASLFARKSGDLAGRRILISDDLELLPCWGASDDAGPTVFFQPRGEDAGDFDPRSDVSIPESLKHNLAYMHRDLTWQVRNVHDRYESRPGRDFLEGQRLVLQFRRQDIVEKLRRVLRGSPPEAPWADALRLIFNLTAPTLNDGTRLDLPELKVPTPAGWLTASRALFSEDWSPAGALLKRLIDEVGDESEELASLKSRMLDSPSDWPFPVNAASWLPFLRRIGVKDGLWPETHHRELGDHYANEWTVSNAATWAGLAPSDTELWSRAVGRGEARPWRTGIYRAGTLFRLPGQSDFDRMAPHTRRLYGRLAAMGLGRWPAQFAAVHISRPHFVRETDDREWPSPAWAFLSDAEWVAVTRPGEPGRVDLRTPSASWHFKEHGGTGVEPMPLFSPLVAHDLREALDDPATETRMRSLGLHSWTDAAEAGARLGYLGALLAAGIPESQLASFRKAYERSWRELVRSRAPLPWSDTRAATLVIARRGRLGTLAPHESDAELYVLTEEDHLAETLLALLDVSVLRVDPQDGSKAVELLAPLIGDRIRPIRRGDFRVRVDDIEVQPDASGVPLVTRERSWLVGLLALTLELKATQFNRQTDQTVRSAVERLRRIRLRAGSSVRVELDQKDVPLPAYFEDVFALPNASHPTVALRGAVEPLDWSTLGKLAQPIADLCGQPLSGPQLRLAIATLAGSQPTGALFAPTTQQYSEAFAESPERVNEILRGVGAELDDLVYLLRPVFMHIAGRDIREAVAAGESLSTLDSLTAILEFYADALPVGVRVAELIRTAQSSAGLAELRDELGLDYASFNATLLSLGPPYLPFRNEDGQRTVFEAYLAEHRARIENSLRAAYIDAFDARQDLTAYAQAASELLRAIQGRGRATTGGAPILEPDPRWLDAYDLPPTDVLATSVSTWLRSVGANPDLLVNLGPIETVREVNRAGMVDFIRRARMVVLAWCRKNSAAPPAWRISADELVVRAGQSGILDFRAMDDGSFIAWLDANGEWPKGMSPTLEVEALGLTAADTREAEQGERQERAAAEHERRTVVLDGRRVGLDLDEVGELIEMVRAGITAGLLATPETFSGLDALQPRGAPGKGQRPPGRGRTRQLPEPQREVIGFVGEFVIYHWLLARFTAGPSCWRSRNRRFVFPDDEGDDGLGYDFVIPRHRGRLFFEVKASADPAASSFELTDAEVRAAQEHGSAYRILFVRNALNSALRTIHPLPNPLSPRARSYYRMTGRGISYGFRLATLLSASDQSR